MLVKTDYFGDVEYDKNDLLFFPDGLLGFQDIKYFLPFCLEENDDSVILLQSTEKPEIAFLVINPYYLLSDYKPVLTTEELEFLKVSDSGDLCYYAICVVRSQYLDSTVNLKCPLAVNPETRVGIQVIMQNTPYGSRPAFKSFPAIQNTDIQEEGTC